MAKRILKVQVKLLFNHFNNGKYITIFSALKKHLKFTHSDFRPFPCELCGRGFKDSTGLKASCMLSLFKSIKTVLFRST